MAKPNVAAKLNYKVVAWSSYSSNYEPSNILVDCPSDQACRWSSDSNSPPQFLVLELEAPAVVETITFGKYEKTHVCNLKRFKVFGGPSQDSLIEILDSGLNNDHIPETFSLEKRIEGHHLPCRYIKIVPLLSWGTSFNFSIWYVELRGLIDPSVVEPAVNWYNQFRENETIRLCLKHFRKHNYLDAFNALQKKTKVQLEHSRLTELHDALVIKGDYKACEELVVDAADCGLFNDFVTRQDFVPRWTRIDPPKKENHEMKPGQRGGHQMVIDPYTETVYLFGGWDGETDLADLWAFHVPTQQWTCLSSNTELDGGPSARSCHKVILDFERKQLFVLGRYVEPESRNSETLKSSFYVYDIILGKWILITPDTYSMGGPQLLFDHQMALDMENQVIYVFGGKILTGNEDRVPECRNYSGLFSYHIPTNAWRKLKEDCPEMRSRIGHSMLFNQNNRKLYIFSGQRGKDFLNDFFTYDVDNDKVCVLSDMVRKEGAQVPPPGFTQRATLDAELNVMHVLLGLSKNKEKDRELIKNSLWLYDIQSATWFCLLNVCATNGSDVGDTFSGAEPVPRFAHQLVYDHIRKVHYMFGGNPGFTSDKSKRLDDFWALSLSRPSNEHMLRRCRCLIRTTRFKELTAEDPMAALHYLQTDLSEVIHHEDTKEALEFHRLTHMLFDDGLNSEWREEGQYRMRSELFDKLVDYFPTSMTQPKQNLLDLVTLH